jgi:hypothetical protein
MEPETENPHSARLRDLDRLTESFFLGPPLKELVVEVPFVLQSMLDSFKINLQALFWATQLPYTLTLYAARMRAFDRHLAAERILALDPEDLRKKEDDPSYEKSETYLKKVAERDAQALATAWANFRREHLTPDRTGEQAIKDLIPFLDHDPVCTASKELMRQSVVLAWVALEALATDLFVLTLNSAPHLTVLVLRDEQCKKRFQSRDFARIIEQHGFELSNRMGEVLKSLGNLDDPETIKAVFQVICPNSESLRTTLAQPELWRLYQRRNLLVHRAGVVDKQFLEKTGEQSKVGTKLAVVSEDVTRYLALVRGVAEELFKAVAEVVK